ncbi:hypothetical protein JHK82_024241 [Glycine max]|uniref:Uncharacterized protein n=2 Tax=Glycine subgen. Soja TaxID=1462606 RepID=A0A0R0IB46_SOYBN|nr:hypothetical protein JHK87_024204 [Glycine soja]KAG5006272.1 hypothetical protein JHK85_024814 [Glycine max]KAG5012068.1 hypothetical protein JHK86_024329 [Glycine max]KAG5133053.1 hypothetical protein JHK82_024241 [Glycine max]KAH1041884.1 hypothetical protein GYH30_024285 [Glycine max]
MTPPGARSRRAMEIPRPFTPENCASSKAGVTATLMMFEVLPVRRNLPRRRGRGRGGMR